MRPNEVFSLNLLDVKFLIGATSTTSDQDLALIIATGAAHSDSEIENGDVFLAFSGLKNMEQFFPIARKPEGRWLALQILRVSELRVPCPLSLSAMPELPAR